LTEDSKQIMQQAASRQDLELVIRALDNEARRAVIA
jgi:hypothetical protein